MHKPQHMPSAVHYLLFQVPIQSSTKLIFLIDVNDYPSTSKQQQKMLQLERTFNQLGIFLQGDATLVSRIEPKSIGRGLQSY